MQTRIVALDLDRTLFDTELFANTLAELSAQLIGISPVIFKDEMIHYKVGQDDGLQYYDYFGHMASHTMQIHGTIRTQLVDALRKANDSYVYEDAVLFLEKLHSQHVQSFILSYGEERYQRLKYEVSPELHSLEVYVTLQDKAEWLATNYALPNTGVLVDDKDAYGTLPSNWKLCLLQRDAGEILRFDTLYRHVLS